MNQQMKDELDALSEAAQRAGKPLLRQDVLEFAEANRTSAIARKVFEDDDATAARAHRLRLCGALVRAYIKIVPPTTRPVRALVHVPSDAAGYRPTGDVAGNPNWRGELVNDALGKITRLRDSFAFLPELEPLWTQVELLVAQFRAQLAQKRAAG